MAEEKVQSRRRRDIQDHQHYNQVSPHEFRRRGWRFWICTHCYAPKSMHPRQQWVRSRPLNDNKYISSNAPHFNEGW